MIDNKIRFAALMLFTLYITLWFLLVYAVVAYGADYENDRNASIQRTPRNIEEFKIAEIPKQEIDKDFNIFVPSGYSSEELSYALTSENHKAFEPYLDTFVQAEKVYGVNALYLLSKLGYESGWGRYMAADNNVGGWTDGKGGFRDFDSVESCIMYIASKIATDYKIKVGYKLDDICSRYCPEEGYTDMVIQIMKERERAIERGIMYA